MISTIRNYSKIIIIIICVAMVVTGAFGLGYGFLNRGDSSGDYVQSANIAVVNGNNISQEEYFSVLRNQMAGMNNVTRAQEIPMRYDVLNSLIDMKLIMQEADNLKIKADASNEDVNEFIDSLLEEYDMTEEELKSNLEINQMSFDQFKDEVKTDIERNDKVDQVLETVYADVTVDDSEIVKSYEKIHPQALSVSFDDNKEEAREKIDNLYNELTEGVDFVELAEENSDMAKIDLGDIARDNNTLPEDVRDKLFAVEETGLTDIIEGDDAYYVFNVIDRKVAKGEDYEENKEDIKNEILVEKQNERVLEWLDELKAESDIEINDPVLNGYRALESKNIPLAVSEFEKALESNSSIMTYVYLAEAYKMNDENDKAEEIFETAIEEYSYDWEIHYQYAAFLIEEEDEERALDLLDEASELAGNEMMAQYQIYMAYAYMGADEKAEAAMEKINEIQKEMESEQKDLQGDSKDNQGTELEDLEIEDVEMDDLETMVPEN